jgi:cytochrome c556
MRKTMQCWALALGALVAGSAMAQAKPEQSIRYRQSVFTLVGWNFGPMAGMVRGAVPFDKAQFAMRAQRVAELSLMPLEGFPKGSEKGARTEAKPEIWTDWKDFEVKMKNFQAEAKSLAAIAKTGDEAAIKAQFGKTGGTCKACHDKYKTD